MIVSNYPFPTISGGRKRTLRLLEAMERAGLAPVLLAAQTVPISDAQVLEARERGWAVERYELHMPRWRRPLRHLRPLGEPASPALARRVEALARAREVALVQAEERLSARYLACVPLGTVPAVLGTHNVDSDLIAQQALTAGSARERLRLRYRAARRRRLERHLARRADAVLCVSEHDHGYFEAAGAGRRAILAPNGVDDDLFEIPPPGAPEHVLFFGQLSYAPNVEGLERFLGAWPAVARARPNARLRIAGASPPESLRALASSFERVDVLGFVDDLASELARCRVVVAPLWQGAGTRMKVLEAMAAGRPVVGTPVGVERIGFVPGVHGEQADTPAELAAAVERLLAEPGRAAAQGREARRHAEEFRWSRTLAPVEALYRRYAEAYRAQRRAEPPGRRTLASGVRAS